MQVIASLSRRRDPRTLQGWGRAARDRVSDAHQRGAERPRGLAGEAADRRGGAADRSWRDRSSVL